MPSAGRARSEGFSLIELLIALVFISFLMAGMLRIYGSAIQGFSAANESVKAQRDNRASMESLEDDISQAGFVFPNATNPIPFSVDSTSGQNPLMILPSQTLTVRMPDPSNPFALQPVETITYDELQFTTDQPLPLYAHLTALPTSNGAVTVQFTQGGFADLRGGDMIVMLDGPGRQQMDVAAVDPSVPASGTAGTIPLSGASGQVATTGGFGSGGGGLLRLQHPVGSEMMFIRPGQVIRYAILPLTLDPSNAAATVPCLVRDQAPYPTNGLRIVWPAAGAVLPAGYSRTVVAENVTGLRFDISVDQGKTWTRGANWAATVTNLDAALAALAAANPQAGYATAADNPSAPAWYRKAPVLFRADVTTRTVLKRTDYSATANTAAYRTRTQTLLLQPRNFGLGIGD